MPGGRLSGVMRCSTRLTRRSIAPIQVAVGLGLIAASLVMLFVPAGAQTDDSGGSSATLTSEGWWERKPNLPNVPATGLPVAAENGNPSRVSAFGLHMSIGADEVLASLKLVLKESTEPGANFPPITEQSQGQAQTNILVVACPITSIYTPVDGGELAAAPVADCDLARGDGKRNHTNATWEFDLTSIAELWASNAIEQKGILLVERVGSPLSFQVSFQDRSTNTPLLELETEFVEEEIDDTPLTEEEFEEFVEGGTTDDTSGGGSFFEEVAASVTGSPDTPLGITDTPPTTAPSEPEPESNEPIANRVPTKGSLPIGALGLVPGVLGLALLFGVVLGPAGDPATARTREGGLSRALARRDSPPTE